jgi:flagellin
MGIRINTNVTSINSRRHLQRSTEAYGKSMERLSSGFRINRAGDDAAGLAVSEGLRADIRTLHQASRNAADGVSLVQTAEGALDEVSNILLRMKELAQQAINGTLSDTDRGYLDSEYTALSAEIDRIAAGTVFNGVNLLDGNLDVDIQVGIGTASTDTVEVALTDNMNASGIGLSEAIGTVSGAVSAMTEIDDAISSVLSTRGDFGALQNRLESTIRNIDMTSENLSAANSRIRDVDVARETAHLTSHQILQMAGTSMLATANMTTSMAIAILRRD